jgi:hypothetical protein
MGKKRRIRASAKFNGKHSTHPANGGVEATTPLKTAHVVEIDTATTTPVIKTAPAVKVTETEVTTPTKNTTKTTTTATFKKTKSVKKKTS